MANYKVTDAELISIADAIRLKGGTSASLAFPSGFVSAVQDLSTGFSAADEGKVVHSGALSIQDVMSVSQNSVYDTTLFSQVNVSIPEATLVSKTISENGTYYAASDSADGFSQVVVDVSSGGGSNVLKDVVERTISSINDSTITKASNYAFASCIFLSFASLQNCTSIGFYAFSGCNSLDTLNLPNCKEIEQQAFDGCGNLKNVSLPNCEFIKYRAFQNCGSLSFISLPECKKIYSSAFMNCSRLNTVILNKCNSIQGDAFEYCYRLSKLYILAESVPQLNNNPFMSTPISNYSTYLRQYGSIYVPSSLYDAYLSSYIWSNYSARFVSLTDEEIAEL